MRDTAIHFMSCASQPLVGWWTWWIPKWAENQTGQKAQGQVSVTCRMQASVKGTRATRGCRAGAGEGAAAQAVGLVAVLEYQGAGVKEGKKLSDSVHSLEGTRGGVEGA